MSNFFFNGNLNLMEKRMFRGIYQILLTPWRFCVFHVLNSCVIIQQKSFILPWRQYSFLLHFFLDMWAYRRYARNLVDLHTGFPVDCKMLVKPKDIPIFCWTTCERDLWSLILHNTWLWISRKDKTEENLVAKVQSR